MVSCGFVLLRCKNYTNAATSIKLAEHTDIMSNYYLSAEIHHQILYNILLNFM